ncbi:MAG: putative Fe-S cluster protein YjdI [Litorivivens sp.]
MRCDKLNEFVNRLGRVKSNSLIIFCYISTCNLPKNMKEIIKEYTNGDITIVWQPGKCIHAAECVKALPKVYDPNGNPWIKMENASSDELVAQIKLCPSGALSMKSDSSENVDKSTKVDILPNGPLLVHGSLDVSNSGKMEKKEVTTAFCRCGASASKPYCDGSHNNIGFEG